MSVVKSITSSLGLGFDLTGKAAMIASTNIVELAGGIDALAALSSQYYQSFYTDAERQADLQKLLADSFSELNVAMPATREEFRAYVDALDLTTEAGQASFAALMQLVPGMDQYLSAVEAATRAAQDAAQAAEEEARAKAEALKSQGLDLQLRLYDALGQSSEALALRRQMEIEATDESLRVMLQQIYAAQDATQAQKELADAQNEAADAARNAASAAIDATQAAFSKLQDSASLEKDRLATELDIKLSTIDAERSALEKQRDTVLNGYAQSTQAVDKYVDKLKGISDAVSDFIAGASGSTDPFKRLTKVFNEFKGGLLPDSSALSSILGSISSAGSGGFASAIDQARAIAISMNQAQVIGNTANSGIGSAQSQYDLIAQQASNARDYYATELAKLDESSALAKELHDSQLVKLDEQLSEAQKQINALLGVDDRILTMSEAAAEFYAALESANALQAVIGNEQISAINRVEMAVIELGEQMSPTDGAGYWAGYETSFAPTSANNAQQSQTLSDETLSLLKEILMAAKSNAEHSSKSASMLQEITIGGIDVRVDA